MTTSLEWRKNTSVAQKAYRHAGIDDDTNIKVSNYAWVNKNRINNKLAGINKILGKLGVKNEY